MPKEQIDASNEVTDEEIAAFFEENKEQYRLPLQRKIRYLSITSQPFQSRVTVSEREIERDYNRNLHLYETPLQVRASHILFKTADKDEEEVQRQAEEVLAQVKSGGDFAGFGKEALRGYIGGARWGSRLLRSRRDGARVRTGGLFPEGRRYIRARKERLRLPHHQGYRTSRPIRPGARRRARRDTESADSGKSRQTDGRRGDPGGRIPA